MLVLQAFHDELTKVVLEPDPTIMDDDGQLRVPDSLSKSRFTTSRGLFSAVAGVAGIELMLIGSSTGIAASMEDGVPLLLLAW